MFIYVGHEYFLSFLPDIVYFFTFCEAAVPVSVCQVFFFRPSILEFLTSQTVIGILAGGTCGTYRCVRMMVGRWSLIGGNVVGFSNRSGKFVNVRSSSFSD